MNVDDLYGTLYVPKDGTMDPAGTCTTLTRAASARGATVRVTDPPVAFFLCANILLGFGKLVTCTQCKWKFRLISQIF